MPKHSIHKEIQYWVAFCQNVQIFFEKLILQKTKITPDTNFESISYNLFTKNDNCVNTKSNPDIYFFSDISALDTKYFNQSKTSEGFEFLCKNALSVLHVNITSVNKHLESFKHFYSTLNCTFSVIFLLVLSIFVHKEVYFESRADLP